jgi:predicted RNase H-like nuclease
MICPAQLHAQTCIVGFDSAWTNRNLGAICALMLQENLAVDFIPPQQVNFDEALAFIDCRRSAASLCLVAIDQPTIVPNEHHSRPVDRVAASLMSYVGGGVQPANRSKKGMFDDEAPIWDFKSRLRASEEPEASRKSSTGVFIIEVFPALALTALNPKFCRRLKCPKYNPANKKKFQPDHWLAVIQTIVCYAETHDLTKIKKNLTVNKSEQPTKADQDKLDSVLCALVGYHWKVRSRTESLMIGDLTSGYMIAPAHADMRARLEAAAKERGVPIA